jgi:hypothetical protein
MQGAWKFECKMHGIQTQVPKKKVIADISLKRWGVSQRTVNQSTFWRWCDCLEISSNADFFSLSEYKKLLKYALHLRCGGNKYNFTEESYDDDCSTVSR